MTGPDRERGELVQVLVKEAVDVRQAVNAVYCRNTQLAARIACVLDFFDASSRALAVLVHLATGDSDASQSRPSTPIVAATATLH